MPRDIIPTKHESDNTDPIITASPEMKSPGNPAGQISEDKPMQSVSQRNEGGAKPITNADEDEGPQPGNLAYSLFRDHKDEMEIELSQKFKSNDDLHPFVQVLSISDLDGCVAVENAAFPEDQRASREQVRSERSLSFRSLCILEYAEKAAMIQFFYDKCKANRYI